MFCCGMFLGFDNSISVKTRSMYLNVPHATSSVELVPVSVTRNVSTEEMRDPGGAGELCVEHTSGLMSAVTDETESGRKFRSHHRCLKNVGFKLVTVVGLQKSEFQRVVNW